MKSRNVEIFPSIGARLKASVIDSIVIILLVAVLAEIYTVIRYESPMVGVVLFSIAMGYEPILVWKRGMTIGHQMMGFRVIDADSKTKLNLGKALLRFLLKSVLGVFSFVWALFTDSQKTLHDLITHSSVINIRASTEQLQLVDSLHPSAVSGRALFVQRSKTRRIITTIFWELAVFIFVSILLALMYPPECVETRGHVDLNCQTFELISALIWGSLSVTVLVFGASGRLPGAKRQPAVGSTLTG